MNILIKNAKIITMNKEKEIIDKGKILIKDDKIEDLGKDIDIENFKADKEINAKGNIVMPGLINGHNHFEQSFMLGLTRLYPGNTGQWIKNFKIPLTQQMNKRDYYLSNILTSIQLIRNGVTTSMNSVCQQSPDKIMEFGIEEAIRAVEETGIRSIIAVGPADRFEPEEFLVDAERAADIVKTSIEQWNHDIEDRVRIWAGPAGIFSASKKLWSAIKKIVDRYDVGIHTHIASFETGDIVKADEYGFLGPNVTGAHCVWLNSEEIKIMKEKKVKAIHNPIYKLSYAIDSEVNKFGDGIAPINDMIDNNITVGLGQDGCMGDTQNLFKEMRCLAFTQQYKMLDKNLFKPYQLLEMVTINNAKAMLWEEEIGSLEKGKKADLIIVKLESPDNYPKTDILANLVYQGNGRDVQTVIINGNIVMENKKIKNVNTEMILKKANIAANELVARTNIKSLLR